MTVKIFLTGATGYVGGTALDHIYKAHKDYDYTLLVRNEERAKPVKAKYPTAKFVYGSLDDAAVLEKAAAEADVVVHTADSSDNVPAANAIAKGIAAGHTAQKPGYWIHLCGTGLLTYYDSVNKRGGEPPIPEEKYHDIDDIKRLINFPEDGYHRNVDIIVQASASDAVKIAIVSPPTIYGTGTGPVNTSSIQVPDLVKHALEKGWAPIVGAGKTEWDNVHVADLGNFYVKLVEATQDPSKNSNPEIFGVNGYFFVANGVHVWSDITRQVVDEINKQGFKKDVVTKTVDQEVVNKMDYAAAPSWGQNSKGVPQRAKKYLGWEAKEVRLEDTIAETVAQEAKALGL